MKIISLGRKYSSGTLALGPFSPKRHYPRLSEVAISPGRRTSRPGENSPKSILAPQNHSCLGEILSLGLNMQKNNNFYYLRANMHASYDQNNKNQHAYTINSLP